MNLERLKTIHNGDKVHPTFSVQEMERRVTALRKEMADTGVDAVLFTSYHNINYYSDFLFTSFGRNYALVVTQDSATTMSANIDAGQPWRRSFGDNLVYTDWQRDNYRTRHRNRAGQRRRQHRPARRRGRPHPRTAAGQGRRRRARHGAGRRRRRP